MRGEEVGDASVETEEAALTGETFGSDEQRQKMRGYNKDA